METLEKLVRENIRRLRPYASARSEFKGQAEVFLDANENPFETECNRYPDPLQSVLKQRIAAQVGLPATRIFLGNGSDEAIDLLIRIFCQPREDHILVLPPTYGMYQVSADIAEVEVKKVNLLAGFEIDVAGILETANDYSKLLFICSPNNPTGNNLRREDIEALLEGFPGIVVVDEAYIDFSEQASCADLIERFPNLVVMRTFSKAWGLAGIRLGMAFANEWIIRLFNKVKPPYNVNQLTQQAALKALEAPEQTAAWIQLILKERKRLEERLSAFEFVEQVHPSAANFLLVKLRKTDELYDYLVAQKIIVRNRSKVVGCEGCLRFTVGRPEENDQLLRALIQYSQDTENRAS